MSRHNHSKKHQNKNNILTALDRSVVNYRGIKHV